MHTTMHYTLQALLQGEPVAEWYQAAKEHWEQALSKIDATDPKAVARVAGDEQFWFENNCGGRFIGQEVMVVAAIAHYHSSEDGFGDRMDKAEAMYRGLIISGCSSEIRWHAEGMLGIYPELKEE